MMALSYISFFRVHQLVRTTRRTSDTIQVRSLSGQEPFLFSRSMLFLHRAKVAILLSQVNDALKQSVGGADTWFHARYDWSGGVWCTSLSDVDELLAMGRALGYVGIYPPTVQACDAPSVCILDKDAAASEKRLPRSERHHRLSTWSFKYLRHN
jgi:hypothetical protein